jgi:hypothetical protein
MNQHRRLTDDEREKIRRDAIEQGLTARQIEARVYCAEAESMMRAAGYINEGGKWKLGSREK